MMFAASRASSFLEPAPRARFFKLTWRWAPCTARGAARAWRHPPPGGRLARGGREASEAGRRGVFFCRPWCSSPCSTRARDGTRPECASRCAFRCFAPRPGRWASSDLRRTTQTRTRSKIRYDPPASRAPSAPPPRLRPGVAHEKSSYPISDVTPRLTRRHPPPPPPPPSFSRPRTSPCGSPE